MQMENRQITHWLIACCVYELKLRCGVHVKCNDSQIPFDGGENFIAALKNAKRLRERERKKSFMKMKQCIQMVEKEMEEKEDQAQQVNGMIMMQKYLLVKHEIMCAYTVHATLCTRTNEREEECKQILNTCIHM